MLSTVSDPRLYVSAFDGHPMLADVVASPATDGQGMQLDFTLGRNETAVIAGARAEARLRTMAGMVDFEGDLPYYRALALAATFPAGTVDPAELAPHVGRTASLIAERMHGRPAR